MDKLTIIILIIVILLCCLLLIVTGYISFRVYKKSIQPEQSVQPVQPIQPVQLARPIQPTQLQYTPMQIQKTSYTPLQYEPNDTQPIQMEHIAIKPMSVQRTAEDDRLLLKLPEADGNVKLSYDILGGKSVTPVTVTGTMREQALTHSRSTYVPTQTRTSTFQPLPSNAPHSKMSR